MSSIQEKIRKVCNGMKITTVVFCILTAVQMVLAAAIVFFLFSVLFSYGAELQQQSDETL